MNNGSRRGLSGAGEHGKHQQLLVHHASKPVHRSSQGLLCCGQSSSLSARWALPASFLGESPVPAPLRGPDSALRMFFTARGAPGRHLRQALCTMSVLVATKPTQPLSCYHITKSPRVSEKTKVTEYCQLDLLSLWQ